MAIYAWDVWIVMWEGRMLGGCRGMRGLAGEHEYHYKLRVRLMPYIAKLPAALPSLPAAELNPAFNTVAPLSAAELNPAFRRSFAILAIFVVHIV